MRQRAREQDDQALDHHHHLAGDGRDVEGELGAALLQQALHGFRRAGLGGAFLEVTAQNDGAIRLYRRLGFRCRKTIYKAVDTSVTQSLVISH